MPRGPRLDAPGALHHVMVRGIERRPLFYGDRDRADLVDRLEGIADATGLQVLGWALLPNHFHLLVRTGMRPLATAMRRLLTGYVGHFNRRHRRSGHLVQNRYKSVLVEEEPDLLELGRYIHLNPLRAGVGPTLVALDRFPWTGPRALLGRVARPWQGVGEVLGRSAGVRGRAGAIGRSWPRERPRGDDWSSRVGASGGVLGAGKRWGPYGAAGRNGQAMNASSGAGTSSPPSCARPSAHRERGRVISTP